MYSPPILFSTQDDINDRRKVRNKYRVSARQDLLESIIAAKAQKDHSDALSMDKKTKAAKVAAEAARVRGGKNRNKKKTNGKNAIIAIRILFTILFFIDSTKNIIRESIKVRIIKTLASYKVLRILQFIK